MNVRQSDYIERLFTTISSDPTMPAELKISLLRIQLPLHKLSLSDPHFLKNENHPARKTLFIARKLSNFAKTDTSLIGKVEQILGDLNLSTPTATIFVSINQKLQLLLNNLNDDQYSQPEQQNSQLKEKLNTELKYILKGQAIPNPCKTLLLKLWPNTLFYLLKKHGDTSPNWLNAIKLYKQLLDSVQEISTFRQKNNLKNTYMSIARNNNNILLLYHQESKLEPEIKSLISHYNHMLSNTLLADNTDFDSSNAAIEKINTLPPGIKPGVWCEIYIDEATPTRRLRLSVININTGTLIFVNRNGIKKLEKDAAEFSADFERGLSRIYKHDSLFTKPSTSSRLKKIG